MSNDIIHFSATDALDPYDNFEIIRGQMYASITQLSIREWFGSDGPASDKDTEKGLVKTTAFTEIIGKGILDGSNIKLSGTDIITDTVSFSISSKNIDGYYKDATWYPNEYIDSLNGIQKYMFDLRNTKLDNVNPNAYLSSGNVTKKNINIEHEFSLECFAPLSVMDRLIIQIDRNTRAKQSSSMTVCIEWVCALGNMTTWSLNKQLEDWDKLMGYVLGCSISHDCL